MPFYAEAFGIPESRVVPTGIPRMDRYFDPAATAAGREAALAAFPMTRGRSTILFAPTFRGDGPRDAYYDPAWLDYAALHALAIEQDAIVIIRMHPFVRAPLEIPEAFADRLVDGSTSSIDVNDLLFIVDLLVTDYSSIVFEFSTLAGRCCSTSRTSRSTSRRATSTSRSRRSSRAGSSGPSMRSSMPSGARTSRSRRSVRSPGATSRTSTGPSTDRVIDEIILAR